MRTIEDNQKLNKIVCQIVLPYSIRVPEEHFQFPDKDIQVDLLFTRYIRTNQKDQFAFDHKNQIMEKERFGRYDYSIVDIRLEKEDFNLSPISDVHNIRVLALGIVRKFIQFYKLVYDEYWLIEPSINDILSFVVKCYSDEKELPGIVASFIETPHGNKIVGIKSYLDQKQSHKAEMMRKLVTNFDLPIYIKLMMHGNRLCFEESFDVAIVLFDRSFESFFDILVKIHLMKTKLYDSKWESYMRMNLVGRNKQDSKLKKYSELVSKSGNSFDSPEEKYDKWYQDCHLIRNNIVHGRLNDVKEEVAHKAMMATRQAFEFFGWIWYDIILVNQKYFDKSQNKNYLKL